MELHNLTPAEGSVKKGKRIARGTGSGRGGTATRGHKGAKSRSGYKRKRSFEGGQMPLQMRLPKRGFKNRFRVSYTPLNVSRLESIADKNGISELTFAKLVELGLVKKSGRIKILGEGELTKSLKVEAHACSENAKSVIESKGGSVTIL